MLWCLTVSAVSFAADEARAYEAEYLYGAHGQAVYQVQVIDEASGKKTSIGSGFQFNAEGYVATNYHVVAEAVHRPESNRVEYLNDKGKRGALQVVIADVVHDLAILKMDTAGGSFLSLNAKPAAKGSKIFSIGNPHDIGFTIIEGTYNGLAKDTLIDKIHFSGSLNPGMSGGPAINREGSVVGVNVATAGNQISFLVPVQRLADLWQAYRKRGADFNFIASASQHIEEQLLENQERIVSMLLAEKWESMDFGPVAVPGRIHKALKCWGGANHKEKDSYKYFYSMCSSGDRIFLDKDFDTGVVAYRYNHITGKDDINLLQFYNLYEKQYSYSGAEYQNGNEDNVTNFVCNDSFIQSAGEKWKASFCVRRYKKYPKIYDMHVYMAALGAKKSGLTTTLLAQGVSEANALKLAEAFMNGIRRPSAEGKEAAP